VTALEIGDEARFSGPPRQLLLRSSARRGDIERREVRQPGKMAARLLGRLADDGHLELAPDDLSVSQFSLNFEKS